MPDTAISALTAASALTGTEEIPLSDGTATTKAATANQVKTFVNTAPVFAAGSASANSHPKFTAGTLLTTAEDGAVEFNGDNFYGTSDAGNRGYIPLKHFIRQASSRALTSTTTEQQLFSGSANGRLALEVGVYLFQCQFYISGLSATSGNLAFDLVGAGSAVLADVLYNVVGVDGNSNTAATQTGCMSTAAQSPASAVTAGTGTAVHMTITGTFEVSTAGTIQPAVTLVTAAAGTVAAGSYFVCERMSGNVADGALGQWD